MSGFGPTSACGRGCLPRPGVTPRVGWAVRAGRLLALVAVLGLGVGVAALQPIVRGRGVRGWFRLLLRAAGVRLQIRGGSRLSTSGPPAAAGTLVTANHVSWLDIPAVLAVERLRVVAKSDVRRWPVIGLLAAAGGTLFIDRRSLRRLPRTVTDIAASLRDGRSVLVFPEGSTWCGRTHGRFYPAAFQAAADAGAPVRPVQVRYLLGDGQLSTAAAFVGEDTLLDSVLRVIAVRGLTVEVRLGAISTGPTAPMPSLGRAAVRRAWAVQTRATFDVSVQGDTVFGGSAMRDQGELVAS